MIPIIHWFESLHLWAGALSKIRKQSAIWSEMTNLADDPKYSSVRAELSALTRTYAAKLPAPG